MRGEEERDERVKERGGGIRQKKGGRKCEGERKRGRENKCVSENNIVRE